MTDSNVTLNSVGPVLQAGPITTAVLAAIRKLNKNVTLQDRGSYIRVLVPMKCVVTRETIEEQLGQPFHFPGDLESIMPSFKGLFAISEAEAVWEFKAGADK